ncbi:MAG: class I SAM-dependent methyltransferase [Flavobacteriales bacterium]|nr:class I SAM-dependent methyltransferase [Flavobacteriales bacterium]
MNFQKTHFIGSVLLHLHDSLTAHEDARPRGTAGKTILAGALLLLLPFVTVAQEKESRRDRIARLNCGIIDDVAAMERAAGPELDIYGIRNGDTIADIGFGWAWLEGLLMLTHDSLTIYANDVDRQALRNIDRVTGFYLDLRKTRNTNTLHIVKGGSKTTNLPSATFSKVIIRETFHHFSEPEALLADIRRILKSDGRVFLLEPMPEVTGISPYCGATIFTRADMEGFIARAGFRLIAFHDLSHLPPYSVPWVTFEDADHAPLVVYEMEMKDD